MARLVAGVASRWRRFWVLAGVLAAIGVLLAACGGGGGGGGAEGSGGGGVNPPVQPTTPPTIATQPADGSAVAGSAVSFSVVANNAVGYQWQVLEPGSSTWVDVPLATAAVYTTPATAVAMNQARYRVRVSGALGDPVFSNTVQLTVTPQLQSPRIEVQPAASVDVAAGSGYSLSVTASGSQLSYTWQVSRDAGSSWSDLPWPSQSTYAAAVALATDDGLALRVQVGNSLGVATSTVSRLTVRPAPVAPTFVLQPVDQSVVVGAVPTFSVRVAGTPTPTIQWQSSADGSTWSNLAGPTATAPDLTLPPVQIGSSGLRLRAQASSAAGSVVSATATLTVSELGQPARISRPPADAATREGQSVTLTVSIAGVPTPAVQWQTAAPGSDLFVNINGATAGPAAGSSQASYSTPALTGADNGRRYRVEVANASGSATSAAALVTVGSAPQVRLEGWPQSFKALLVGTTETLSVSVSGQPMPTIRWLESVNGGLYTPIAGVEGASYTPPAMTTAQFRSYVVEVRNAIGLASTQAVTIDWQQPSAPVILDTRLDRVASAVVGGAATLGEGVSIAGLPQATLQWQSSEDGVSGFADVPGATGPTFALGAAALADIRYYRLRATNSAGSAIGQVWQLVVTSAPVPARAAFFSGSRTRVAAVGEILAFDRPFGGAGVVPSSPAFGVPMPATERQWSRDGGRTWTSFASGSGAPPSASLQVAAADDGLLVRELATNAAGSAVSAPIRVRVDPQARPGEQFWREWPDDAIVSEGSAANFTSVYFTAGRPVAAVEWQMSSDGGANWARLDDVTRGRDGLVTRPLSRSDDGKLFRRAVTLSDGTRRLSGAARVTVRAAPAASLELLAGHIGGRGMLDGRGADTRLAAVQSMARDAAGNVYMVDGDYLDAAYLRRLSPAGDLSTIYLTALAAWNGDDSDYPRRTEVPVAVAATADGTLFIGTRYRDAMRAGAFGRIWRRSPLGVLEVVAGGGSGDGSGAAAGFGAISGMTFGPDGTLFIAEGEWFEGGFGAAVGHCIRKMSPAAAVSTFAGSCAGQSGWRDGPGSQALFKGPRGLAVDAAGVLYVSEPLVGTVRRVATDGTVSTVAGPLWPAQVPGGVAQVPAVPHGLAMAADGRVAVTVLGGVQLLDPAARTLEALPTGPLSDAASLLSDGGAGFWIGTGNSVFWGSAGQNVGAGGYRQAGSAVLLRYANGALNVSAGRATLEGSVDGPGAAATFQMPYGLQPDRRGGLIVTDTFNFTVRRIDGAGLVTTLAGSAGSSGVLDGTAMAARFADPTAVAVAADGTAYVVDRANHVVRRIAPNGAVSTLAGSAGARGTDDGVGSAARFTWPSGIALAPDGSLLVRDFNGLRLVALDGRVRTHPAETRVSGTGGVPGCRGGEGPLAAAPNGSVAIACGSVIYVMSPDGAGTLIGRPLKAGYADGPAMDARFGHVTGLAYDDSGRLWVTDGLTQTLRRVDGDGSVSTILGRSDMAMTVTTAGGRWNVIRGGVVLGATPRLASTTGVAWLGNNRVAVASEGAVLIVTAP